MLAKNLIPYALVAVASFGAGWQINEWRHGARETREVRAVLMDLREDQKHGAAIERERAVAREETDKTHSEVVGGLPPTCHAGPAAGLLNRLR